MNVGRRIYYDVLTGELLHVRGERINIKSERTVEQEISIIPILSQRDRSSFEVMELDFGQYAQDFAESTIFRVNPETKELEFSYPDPNEEEPQGPVYRVPLSEEVEELKSQNEMLLLGLADTYETQQQNSDMLLNAVAEVYELILGGAE